MNYLEIAEQMLKSSRGTTLKLHPGLENYLHCVATNISQAGGQLVSRQVIASIIETWFLIRDII